MRARPLSVSSARLTSGALGELAHADRGDLGGRHPQRHLVLDEVDDEQLELGARDLLLLDRDDLADAMGRIDDEFVGLEALTLGRLLGGHSRNCSLLRLAAAERFGHGSPTARAAPGSLRAPPARAGRGLLGPPADAGRALLGLLTHLPCHSLCVCRCHAPSRVYLGTRSRKIRLPTGSARVHIHVSHHIAHFPQKSKLYGARKWPIRPVEAAKWLRIG